MAKIEVKDIKSNGAELFDDSESFMDELNEDVLEEVNGGMLASDAFIIADPPLPYPIINFPTKPYSPVIL